MRIVISADIEGASGVVSGRETGYPRKVGGDPQSAAEYRAACRWLTEDINAAIEGARAAGACEFVVHDSHGMDYANVLLDELDPSVDVVKGMPLVFFDPGDLEKGHYDAAFLIGMHARAGQPGVQSHVLDWPRFWEVRINGLPVSESTLSIALASYYHLPTILVTGDDLICGEASRWTNGAIETAVVKYSFSRYAARCVGMKNARDLIQSAASRAVKHKRKIPPAAFSTPITLEVDILDPQLAMYVSWMPNIEYDGACTVRYRSDDFLRIYKILFAMFWLSHLD